MDVFAFPSLYEGLGLVVVEAQASGLAVVMSNTIPAEAVVAADLVRRLPIDRGTRPWLAELNGPRPPRPDVRRRSLAALVGSRHDVSTSALELCALYEAAASGAGCSGFAGSVPTLPPSYGVRAGRGDSTFHIE
jgi:glycosyltransferase involved in cell wall biosynthesis